MNMRDHGHWFARISEGTSTEDVCSSFESQGGPKSILSGSASSLENPIVVCARPIHLEFLMKVCYIAGVSAETSSTKQG